MFPGARRTWLRGSFFGSTIPDPDNAGVGKIFAPPLAGGFLMKENKIVKILGLAMFLVISLVCPLIYIENTAISVFFSQNADISIQFIVMAYCVAISQFVGLTLLYLKKNISSLIASLISFFALLFLNRLAPGMSIGPGYIFVFLISFFTIGISYSRAIEKLTLTISDIAEIGVLVALAIVADMFIKFKLNPNGGSISLVMTPLFLISLRKGFFKGFIACGLIFGLINCLMDGYGLATYQYDYLLGYGSCAIIGLFKPLIMNKEHRLKFSGIVSIAMGAVLATIFRTIFSTISGVVLYELSVLESFAYNAAYIIPSGIIGLIISIILYKPLLIIDKKYPNL